MIRKAMEKMRKVTERTDGDAPSASNGSGGSIQDRLNKMRQDGGAPRPHLRRAVEMPAGNGSAPAEEEAFLASFENDLKQKIAKKTESPADILRERMREVREGFGPMRRPRELKSDVHTTPSPANSIITPSDEPIAETGSFPAPGTILSVSSGELAVFHKNVPSRGYQLVYMVNADGTISPQGIYLDAYECREIGALSPAAMADIAQSLTWDRDILVFHLKSLQDVGLIPHPTSPQPAPVRTAPAPQIVRPVQERPVEAVRNTPEPAPVEEPAPEDPGLFRGRRFRISMGKSREWDAIFWGNDEQGSVVAHRTNGQWNLMHLDIERFSKSLILNGQLNEQELREVEESLRKNYS